MTKLCYRIIYVIYLTLLSHLVLSSKLKHEYIISRAQCEVFCVQLQVPLEVLFCSCIQNSILEWSSIRIPVDKDKLGDSHMVLVLILEIKDTISKLLLGKTTHEMLPGLFSLSFALNNLNLISITIASLSFSLQILKTMYR